MKITLIILAVLILWSLWGYFSSRVEQAEYKVVSKNSDYEIREYSSHNEAQTTVNDSYDEALNSGFRIIAGYIFGGNVKKESIAMTAPVTEKLNKSENIAMTAPVKVEDGGNSRIISFVMPKKYDLNSLPTPNDERIRLVEVPAKKVAVLRFSWFRSYDKIKRMETKLTETLSRDGIKIIGTPTYAGYNAPWTPPWMNRNEVMVEVV
ncbi:MAG: heme-binding protein [bacterium]